MAKKKAEAAEPAPEGSTDRFVEMLLQFAEREFGAGVAISGEEAANKPYAVIPWCPSLDLITSGGIIEGSWVGITGNEKTTKTSAALSFAAMAQRPEYGSRHIVYSKVEGRLSTHHLRGIKGLDISPKKFTIFQSAEADEKAGTPAKILTMQDHLRLLEQAIKTIPRVVVIIDSISAFCEEKEANEGVGTETRGGGAKLFSQFLRIMNQVVPVQRAIVIGITQLISNTSGKGAHYTERAARAWRYQCDYQLRTVGKENWESGGKNIGLKIKWACNTSPLGPPGMTAEGHMRYDVGYDRLFETAFFAMQANIIKKKGAWYSLDFLRKYPEICDGEPPSANGGEQLYKLLLKNPQWIPPLEKEVAALFSPPTEESEAA